MTFLGSLLTLDEGARLTGVGLRPLARRSNVSSGTVYMHTFVLPDGADPTAASGSVATFLPAALATIDGNQPDGSTWFATFQLAPGTSGGVRAARTADAAVLRALELTGLTELDVWGRAIRDDDMRTAFSDSGNVSAWPVADLLTGLLVEVTNTELKVVVAETDERSAAESTEERRARLHGLLTSWAATVSGPTD